MTSSHDTPPNISQRLKYILKEFVMITRIKLDETINTFKLFKKVVMKSVTEIQYNLGVYYSLGIAARGNTYVKKNYQKAAKWYKKAAKRGYVFAQYNLGVCYAIGQGVKKNYQEAFKLFKQAAEQGNMFAQYNLGVCYAVGQGVKQNYQEAFKLFKQAAEQGNVFAQSRLGFCYMEGEGVEQNYQEAVKWFRRAAEQDFIEAKFYLALILLINKNTNFPQEIRILFNLFQKIHNSLNPIKYQYNFIESLKEIHEGNQQIILLSNKIYYKAFEQIPFLRYLAQKAGMFNDLYQAAANFVAGRFQELFEYQLTINVLTTQAEENFSPAQVILFYLYQQGNGVEKNIETAKNYLLKAVENNDLLACYVLGKGYLEGEWIELNYEQAKFYLEKVNHQLKQEGIFSHFSDQKMSSHILEKEPPQKNDKIGYSREIKQWIGLLVQTHLTLLQERENQAELENTMALFAHKFRGSLRNIRYYIEKQPSSAKALQSIQIMDSLFDVFSWLSGDVKILHQKLQQDQQGKNSLLEVLNQSLIAVISQVLPQDKMDLIRQYYFQVALQQKHIPQSAKINELEEQYLDEWEHLQRDWEQNWLVLLENPHLDALKTWLAEHFFPIEIIGFEHTPIYFAQYGAKNSLFFIFMTELFLNAVKYYHSAEKQPVQFIWHKPHNDFYCFECTNPAFSDNAQTKGSHKGHSFLNLIANKLKGKFKISFNNQQYSGKLYLPKHYFNGASK